MSSILLFEWKRACREHLVPRLSDPVREELKQIFRSQRFGKLGKMPTCWHGVLANGLAGGFDISAAH